MRPPFRITRRILALCADLGRLVGRADAVGAGLAEPQLRRGNRVRTVQASVGIEGNTLSVEQVTDVLDGKRVVGSSPDYYDALGRSDRAGDSTVFVEFALDALKTALEGVVESVRPRAPDSAQRLAAARTHFRSRWFSRRDYLALHRGIQTATASRDLRAATLDGALEREGDKATARYRSKVGPAKARRRGRRTI